MQFATPPVGLPMRALLVPLALALAACAPRPALDAPRTDGAAPPALVGQDAGTDALLIGSHAVGGGVVWASGTAGTVLRTTDGGATWADVSVPGADTLQFRDVHAFGPREAVVLSIGGGAASRVYRTDDGGASWRQTFVNDEPDGFFDCLGFWDERRGLAFSDAVAGAFLVVETDDGGRTWRPLPDGALPPAQDGEGGFASSGTCVATHGERTAWIAAGNARPARVLRTDDGGRSWTSAPVPLDAGEAAGATSVAFRTAERGVALGGDLGATDVVGRTVARTADGGRSWTAGGPLPFAGRRLRCGVRPGHRRARRRRPGRGGALARRRRDVGARQRRRLLGRHGLRADRLARRPRRARGAARPLTDGRPAPDERGGAAHKPRERRRTGAAPCLFPHPPCLNTGRTRGPR